MNMGMAFENVLPSINPTDLLIGVGSSIDIKARSYLKKRTPRSSDKALNTALPDGVRPDIKPLHG